MEIRSVLLIAALSAGAVGTGSGFLCGRGADALSAKVAGLFNKVAQPNIEIYTKKFTYALLAGQAAWECMLLSKVVFLLLRKDLFTALFLKPLFDQLVMQSFMAAFCLTLLIRGLVMKSHRDWQKSLIGVWLAFHIGIFLGPWGLGSLGYFAGAKVVSKEGLFSKEPQASFSEV